MLTELVAPASSAPDLARVADLFGGARVLRRRFDGPFDAHELLMQGLPGEALTHLVDSFVFLHRTASLDRAMGMSLRTYQRRKDAPMKPLNAEQSGRTWKFAEILARAISVFGSQAEAEQWLERPATGLNQQRPIDLLATPAGVAIVETFLGRLEYGVYT